MNIKRRHLPRAQLEYFVESARVARAKTLRDVHSFLRHNYQAGFCLLARSDFSSRRSAGRFEGVNFRTKASKKRGKVRNQRADADAIFGFGSCSGVRLTVAAVQSSQPQ